MTTYFKKNKKKYAWDSPRFKGIAYYTRDEKDIEAVRKSLKGVSFDKWAEVLRSTYNSDSILRIRVEKGLFKKGDNSLVDRNVFGVDTVPATKKDYPFSATFGKKLKSPKEMSDVRAQVVADYQNAMEEKWLDVLRRKYPVVVNKDVVATVNKHK